MKESQSNQPAIPSSPLPADHQEPRENVAKEPSAAGAQDIFDERFALFMNGLGEACEKQGVRTAVAIVCDPKITSGPIVLTRGHLYEVARALAMVLRRLKATMAEELDTLDARH